MYESDKSGSAISRWGEPTVEPEPSPTPEPEPEIPVLATLSRGQAAVTKEVTQEEKLLVLTNPFDNKEYKYKVKSRTDCFTEGDTSISPNIGVNGDWTKQSAEFEFLENGRLVIRGSWLDIEAIDGQQDDLIILGHYNNIKTGDKNDYVRVGYAMDSYDDPDVYFIKNALNYDENGHSTSSYKDSAAKYGHAKAKTSTIWAYAAVGNHIDTGSGDDYIAQLLNIKDTVFNANIGTGEDKFILYNDYNSGSATYNIKSINEVSVEQTSRITGAEIMRSVNDIFTEYDYQDGWGTQFGHRPNSDGQGACGTLSLINSLFQVRGENMRDYVDISYNENTKEYTVKFKKYTAKACR